MMAKSPGSVGKTYHPKGKKLTLGGKKPKAATHWMKKKII